MINPNPLPGNTALIRKEIALKEIEARELLHWLEQNPEGRPEDTAQVLWRLNEALQAINDLVYRLKPGRPYIVR